MTVFCYQQSTFLVRISLTYLVRLEDQVSLDAVELDARYSNIASRAGQFWLHVTFTIYLFLAHMFSSRADGAVEKRKD